MNDLDQAMTGTGIRFESSLQFARRLDRNDPLKKFRSRFHYPKVKGRPAIYLAGNSLGLQPKSVRKYILQELDDWASLGVEGHYHARNPWMHYHKLFKKTLASLVGAKPLEVVAMNQLTVNLHLMMVSFYRPQRVRYKILTESGAFPSDQYAFESQVKFHGLDPAKAIIELKPREGEFTLRMDDILHQIRTNGPEVALVIFGGVQYYTGQFFKLREITEAAHEVGAVVGFDLAHAIGNVPLRLHDDDVDFGVWCTYKYLNSGPGAVAGAFVHERHARNFSLPRFAGWWGHDEVERFEMKKGFKPVAGADGWQLSNFSVVHAAAHLASLEIFREAELKELRRKSTLLTGYAKFLLHELDPHEKMILNITPSDPQQHGCQLSLFVKRNGRKIFDIITKAGVVADWREPNVIRIAPVPLYNTFEEVFRFSEILRKALPRVA
jgi:kynureninase